MKPAACWVCSSQIGRSLRLPKMDVERLGWGTAELSNFFCLSGWAAARDATDGQAQAQLNRHMYPAGMIKLGKA
eukprot:1141244-Pelagomonas_calceolata.AAC.1